MGAVCGTASSANSVIKHERRVTAGVGLNVITDNTRLAFKESWQRGW